MASKGLSKFGLRARAEKFEKTEKGDEEFDKKEEVIIRCKAEQAVHIIPFVLLASLLILYIFSYNPNEVSVPGVVEDSSQVKAQLLEKHSVEKDKGATLQAFSVYSHRNLHAFHKQKPQQRSKEKAAVPSLKKSKQAIKRSRPKKNSLHRKSRILHNR